MTRSIAFGILIVAGLLAPIIWAQSPAQPKTTAPDARPAFEVATIKPSDPDARGSGIRVAGRRFFTTNTSLSDLMEFAYGLHVRQITGGPAWVETGKYDLLAESEPESKPDRRAMKAMVQKLMADRFQLTFHRDKKELSVYAIIVGKTGPKFMNSVGDPNGSPGYGLSLGAMTVRNATIADFAGWMQRYVMDWPVIDRTGISGRYNFSLDWTPDESQFGNLKGQLPPPTGNVEHPDLYTAIRQQLGLKLESTKTPVDVLVIDHVERPSAN